MKKIIFPMVFFSFLIQTVNFAQSTIIIQPGPEGKDAQLWSITPDLNIGNTPKFLASGWTHGGEPGINRALIDFDLSEIPENAVITSAKLNLYFLCLEPNFMGHTGQNSAILSLVIEPWDEATVTWNTQPATTPENQVYLPQSEAPYMDYTDIDITGLIQSLLISPEEYHGIMMRLQNENPYRCILFASGDYSDTISMRPMLEVNYFTDTTGVVEIQPGQEGKDALLWSYYPQYHFGNSPKFTAMTWSHYRETCTTRSIIEFDLSSVPPNAVITDARLSLFFACQESNVTGHTGDNESLLQLITEPWDEDSVTWSTQPKTTTDFQINLPASAHPQMNYTNIDVTGLVAQQYSYPEQYHGFMLRLADENINKCLLFASSDYMDSVELHPKLTVSYAICTQPLAGFTYEQADNYVNFYNSSSSSDSLLWDFGDGQQSCLENPQHVYNNLGVYEVWLKIWNPCGTDSIHETIYVDEMTGIPKINEYHIKIYPNPAYDHLIINSLQDGPAEIQIFGSDSRTWLVRNVFCTNNSGLTVDLTGLEAGLYFIRIRSKNQITLEKFILLHGQ